MKSTARNLSSQKFQLKPRESDFTKIPTQTQGFRLHENPHSVLSSNFIIIAPIFKYVVVQGLFYNILKNRGKDDNFFRFSSLRLFLTCYSYGYSSGSLLQFVFQNPSFSIISSELAILAHFLSYFRKLEMISHRSCFWGNK